MNRLNPFNAAAMPTLALPRTIKRLIVLLVDASLCVVAVSLAFYLRLGEWVPLSAHAEYRPLIPTLASLGLALPVFVAFGLYRAIFRYSGWPALVTVGKAVGLYALMYVATFTLFGVPGVPRTVGLIQPLLVLFLVGSSRALARYWLGGLYLSQLKLGTLPKVLIYGAGSAGRQLANALANSYEMRVVGYLDDDDRLHGHVLNGLAIYSPQDLAALVNSLGVSDVLLALPSTNRKRRNEILTLMQQAKVSVRTLPSVMELAQGKVSTADLRELDIDDLLGRESVPPNHILLGRNATRKVVLITGAGGSIGSELCRQLLKLKPDTLLLVDQSEFALYEVHQELLDKAHSLGQGAPKLVPLLASVRDAERMREVITTWTPDTIYHAAAYKHVPLVEHNPAEALKNNVWGTWTVAQLAAEHGVADMVLVSTDKAVRPTNIMGASKRLAELVLQGLASQESKTTFSMVRFGNVLGSSGSVVPKFRQQIKNGGPITLTHPEVTRFFMTIPEAAQLVIQAGAMAKGGDVFVLDMGESVKIMDLAQRMIQLSGLTERTDANPDGDIAIEITGLRPGEKLFEELLIGNDPQATLHPRIMKANEEYMPWADLQASLNAMQVALDVNDVGVLRRMLEQLVMGYQPSGDIVDWVHLAQEAEYEKSMV
ncbi:MAG: polysaccharide biosynthesis protein [Betaproteobacteria bacterium]|nr:polysaccharide biosynthesis protein [Betaproteobacteria bacterium]